jgi:hypothetical protein
MAGMELLMEILAFDDYWYTAKLQDGRETRDTSA